MSRTIDLDDVAPGDHTTGTTDTAGTDTGPGTAPPRTPAITKLENQLRDFYTQAGTYLGVMTPATLPGLAIASSAPAAASAWADLAAQDPAVKRALDKFLTGGVWVNLIAVHMGGIVLPILATTGRLPDHISAAILKAAAHDEQGNLTPLGQYLMSQQAAAANGGVPVV